VVAVILTQFGEEPRGAESTGIAPIEVAFAPEVGLQSAAAAVEAVETVKAQTVQMQAARPPEQVAVLPETIVPIEQIDAAKMVAPVEAKAEVVPPPKPKPMRKEVAKIQPKVESKVPPAEVAPVPEAATAAASVDPRSGSDRRHDADARDPTPGGSASAGQADYMSVIRAWLEKHKEYPRQARMRRQEGTAFLYFEMDRNGKVQSFRVTRSSGHDILDREVEDMIQRATPLPPMPPEMTAARLELVVPVRFHLR
jgi:protein TonB